MVTRGGLAVHVGREGGGGGNHDSWFESTEFHPSYEDAMEGQGEVMRRGP